jgi:hypothetical protein
MDLEGPVLEGALVSYTSVAARGTSTTRGSCVVRVATARAAAVEAAAACGAGADRASTGSMKVL